MPFGVQHGLFMNTEERVRRRVREWAATRGGALSAAGGESSDPSYNELVESFQVKP